MSTNTAQKLEDVLLQKGLIDQNQFNEIAREKIETGLSAEKIISKNKLIDPIELIKTKSEITGIPFADPTQTDVNPEVMTLVKESTARKYNLMPFDKDDLTISVAMQDPNDLDAIQYIERSTKLRVQTFVSTSELIDKAIEKEYSKSLGSDVTEAIEQAAASTPKKMKETLKDDIEEAKEVIKVSPVAQIVSIILEYAVKSGASDIHIEPFENNTRIRYRIDGVLQEKFPLPKAMHNSITARIKILASMPIDEKRKPLDGKFKVIFGETKTDLRVSSLPTVFGEKIVIRLLKDQKDTFTLKDLGVWGKAHAIFDKALEQTTGIILVTGPTGSGKTVTLATSIAKLNSIKVNIITLEDPVEINIPGVNQVQVNVQAGLTFASGLRSILRQDPNIIMVGEIRDVETAQLAIQAALTGHLVLATLHTNSAPGAIPRLIDMGVENFLLASTLYVALAQRLTRKICLDCKESYDPPTEIKKTIKEILGDKLLQVGLGPSAFSKDVETDDEVDEKYEKSIKEAPTSQSAKTENDIKLFRGKGCNKCGDTGYKGRIGLYEVMEVTQSIRDLTEKNSPTADIQQKAVEEGMITLVQDGYLKALWGITTIEEVLSVADE